MLGDIVDETLFRVLLEVQVAFAFHFIITWPD